MVYVLLIVWLLTWLGFSALGLKKGWSRIISICGGFVASCVVVAALFTMTTLLSGDAGRGSENLTEAESKPVKSEVYAGKEGFARYAGEISIEAVKSVPGFVAINGLSGQDVYEISFSEDLMVVKSINNPDVVWLGRMEYHAAPHDNCVGFERNHEGVNEKRLLCVPVEDKSFDAISAEDGGATYSFLVESSDLFYVIDPGSYKHQYFKLRLQGPEIGDDGAGHE